MITQNKNALLTGQVGITVNSDWFGPKNPLDPADWNAAERGQQFMIGWFTHPIFVNGDYPEVMKEYVNRNGETPRLPLLTKEQKQMINGESNIIIVSFGFQVGSGHGRVQYL